MSPGPGGYAYKTFVGAEGRGNSMHAKLEYKPIEKTAGNSPGPGNYENKLGHMASAPRYGLGTSKREFIGNKGNMIVPGAGNYDPKTNYTERKAANWGFGSEKRKALGRTSVAPGPGNYSIDSMDFTPGKTKFHMGNKLSP